MEDTRGPRDGRYETARNLFLALLALALSGALLAHRVADPKPAIFLLAALVAFIAVLTGAFQWAFGARPPVWVGLGAVFLVSREVLTLATTRVHAVRDAGDHIYGIPLDIVRTAHVPDTYVYSSYPTIHLLLAEAHLVAGLPLWEGAAVLSLLLGAATLALVVRTAERAWPGSGLAAGFGLLVAFFAIPPAQLFQPMTVSILLFATLVFLVVRDRSVPWAPGLFVLVLLVIGISHPYSAAIIGVVAFAALALEAVLFGRVRFLVAMGILLGAGLLYVGFAGGDLERFVHLLKPNDVAPLPVPGPIGTRPEPEVDSAPVVFGFSTAYRSVGSWAFRLAMGAGLAGLLLSLRPLPRRGMFLQFLLGSAGVTYLVSRVISNGFPTRVLTISSVLVAPFIGLALFRIPKAAALAAVAVLCVLAVTAPSATSQFFPWSQRDPTVHVLDERPEMEETLAFFLAIDNGSLRRSNPISSHLVFWEGDFLLVRAFASSDVEGQAPVTHYIYREDSEESGFAVTVTQSGNEARRDAFTPFPTQGQLDRLASIDRIADVGAYRVHRG
ncbi:MAG: hypothetical protein ACYC2H_06090 [Thermoplasmatota archaeon]